MRWKMYNQVIFKRNSKHKARPKQAFVLLRLGKSHSFHISGSKLNKTTLLSLLNKDLISRVHLMQKNKAETKYVSVTKKVINTSRLA